MKLYKLDPSVVAGNKNMQEELKKLADELADEMLKEKGEEQMLANQASTDNVLTPATDPLVASFQQEFGQDTRVPGALVFPVQAIVGGVVPWVDKGGDSFSSALVGENRQLEGFDPTGAKASADQHAISVGGLSEKLEEDFIREGLMRDSLRPTPPGTSTSMH